MKPTVWLTAILGAIIGAILMFVFMPDPKPVEPDQAKLKELQEQNETLMQDLFISAMTIDSLDYVIQVRDSAEKQLRKDLAAYKGKLNDSTQKIKDLAREILSLKSVDGKDSLCDELAERAQVFTDLYVHYRDLSDSLMLIVDSTRQDLEAEKIKLKQMTISLKDSNKSLLSALQAVVSNKAVLAKSLRRQKLKTIVVAILGIIGTGGALMK